MYFIYLCFYVFYICNKYLCIYKLYFIYFMTYFFYEHTILFYYTCWRHGLVILYLLTGQMYHTFYKSLWARMGHRRTLFHKNADVTTDLRYYIIIYNIFVIAILECM